MEEPQQIPLLEESERAEWRSTTDTRLKVLEDGLATNTSLTLVVNQKLSAHMAHMEPVVTAVRTTQGIINFLGKVANGFSWVGERLEKIIRYLLVLIAVWFGAKAFMTTGSWEAMWKAISGFLK